MMLRRNHANLSAMTVALFVLGGAASPALAQDASAPPDPALRSYLSATGLLSRGMWELAEKDYREFLAANPDHPKAATARYGLGVCLFRMKRYDDAAKELAGPAAAKNFEFAPESRLVLAQCQLAQSQFAQAATSLEKLLRDYPDHGSAGDAAALLVEARYREGKPEAVAAACETLVQRWPQSAGRDRAEVFAAIAAMGLKAYPSALRRLDELLARSPESALAGQATLLAAQCAQQAGDNARAAALYESLRGSKETRLVPDALYGLGCVYRQQKRPDDAARVLDLLLKDHAESPLRGPATLERARVSFDQAEYPRAREAFESAMRLEGVDRAECAYWLAKCDLRSGDAGAAAARLAKAIKDSPESALAPEMAYDRAIALLRSGDLKRAATELGAFLDRYKTHSLAPDAMETLATIHHQAGRYDESARLCRAFLSEYPDHAMSAAVQFLTAENLYLKGDAESAVPAYEAFLAGHADSTLAPTARFRLGTALFQVGKYDQARPLLEEAAGSSDPAFRSAILCLGDLLFQRGEWGLAAGVLGRYAALGKDAHSADDALLKLGLCFQRQDQNAEALSRFDELLNDYTESTHRTQAMFERGRALLALNKPDDAAAAFKRIVKEDGESRFAPLARTELGSMALRSGDFAAASKQFEQAAAAAPDGDAKAEAVFQQAQALLAAGKYAAAADVFESLLRDQPSSARALQAQALGAIATARLKRDTAALERLDAADRDAGGKLDAATRDSLTYERACCLRAIERADEASRLLQNLIEQRPDAAIAPYAALELAAIESDAGRFEPAAAMLTKLRAPGATPLPADIDSQSAYRLAFCLLKLDQPRKAIELLDPLLQSRPDSSLAPVANLLAGECRFKLNRHAEAATNFEALIASPPDDQALASAFLRLGECRAATQDWAGSEKAFTAYLDRFKTGEFWFQARFGIGWAKENAGDPDAAIAAYRLVTEKHQGATAARAQFQIGECLFAKKQYEEAARELLRVDILFAYPEWSAAALYEAGRCFESLAKPELAAEQFRLVKEKYPDTDWARLASERLNKPRASAQPK